VLRALPHGRIRFANHVLAEIHSDEVVLEEVVVEHELGGFAEIQDPVTQRRRIDAVRHVLRIHGAGRVVVTADAADPTRDLVRIAWVLALHEDAIPSKNGRGAVALYDFALLEIDLGVNAEAADDPRDGIPRHVDQMGSSLL
jgi:hypothetical protein